MVYDGRNVSDSCHMVYDGVDGRNVSDGCQMVYDGVGWLCREGLSDGEDGTDGV
jgi:phage major head subunit gpT-like protein